MAMLKVVTGVGKEKVTRLINTDYVTEVTVVPGKATISTLENSGKFNGVYGNLGGSTYELFGEQATKVFNYYNNFCVDLTAEDDDAGAN